MGSVISAFNDVMLGTESSYLNGGDQVINEVVKNTYLLGEMLKGKPGSLVLQNGKTIKWNLRLDDQATFHYYLPDDVESPAQPQTLSQAEAGWRFARDHAAWNKETVALNMSGSDKIGRNAQVVDYKRQLEGGMWTSKCNGMDTALFATPNQATMETAATAKVPYSLAALINENLNTRPFVDGSSTTQWTNVCGIAPATKTGFQNYKKSYTAIGAMVGESSPTNVTGHLFVSLADAIRKTGFDQLPIRPEYSDKRTKPTKILCSNSGMNAYQFSCQANHDSLIYTGARDGITETFRGVPLMYVAALDTAVCFPTGAAGIYSTEADTAGTDNAGPRYWLVNFEYLFACFHSQMYMEKTGPLNHPNQPSSYVMYYDTAYNILPLSRRRHAIVYPAADISI